MLEFDNTFGTIIVYCDEEGCDESEEFEGFDGHCDLQNTIVELKGKGWLTNKKNRQWFHFCCKHKNKK